MKRTISAVRREKNVVTVSSKLKYPPANNHPISLSKHQNHFDNKIVLKSWEQTTWKSNIQAG